MIIKPILKIHLASNRLIGVGTAVVLVAKRDTLFDSDRWWFFL